jgi:hypothetical protein
MLIQSVAHNAHQHFTSKTPIHVTSAVIHYVLNVVAKLSVSPASQERRSQMEDTANQVVIK